MKGADAEGIWECDGCGEIGTLAEVDKHILAQNPNYDDLSSIKCWGSMQVGSPVWQDFHTRGIHPMTHVYNALSKAIMECPEVIPYVLGEDLPKAKEGEEGDGDRTSFGTPD